MRGEKERIQEIFKQLFGRSVDSTNLSWLEALSKISDGRLLAKILYKLEESDLKLVCRVSEIFRKVCERYELHKRFYTGKAYTFGKGDLGNLGDGRTDVHNVEIPVQIQGIPEPVTLISCSGNHTGIVTVSGKVYMFGEGDHGKLGNGRTDMHNVERPIQVQGIPEPVTCISCGHFHTGVVTDSGKAYTFGEGFHGQLGDVITDTDDHNAGTPVQVQGIPEAVKSISCGGFHTGIVTISGKAYTFGDGEDGQLGDGITDDHNVAIPIQVKEIPEPVTSISCGYFHTGIVTVSGKAYTFGDGEYGRLGDGITDDHNVGIPIQVKGITEPVESISCGDYHTGIVTVSGKAYTFGDGEYGRLGDDRIESHNVGIPIQVKGITEPVESISCGDYHTGIVTVSGKAYTFGDGEYGRLGDDRIESHSVGIPAQVQGILVVPVKSISCGRSHTGIVTIPESSLDLDIIGCEYCKVGEAEYFAFYGDTPRVFCSEKCQILYN